LLKKAESTLGYLKIVTPRRNRGQLGHVKMSFGKSDEDTFFHPIKNWTPTNLDPDAVSRHKRTLNRAGWRDNAHAKGFF